MRDPAIIARAQAAIEIIRSDPRADPALMLSFVIWPPEGCEGAVASTRREPVSPEEGERIVALAAEGLTHREIGRRVGRPRPTVSSFLQRLSAPA